jgi:hypothetical protein
MEVAMSSNTPSSKRLRQIQRDGHAEISVSPPRRFADQIERTADDCGTFREELVKIWLAERILSRERARRRTYACR